MTFKACWIDFRTIIFTKSETALLFNVEFPFLFGWWVLFFCVPRKIGSLKAISIHFSCPI